MRTHFEITGKAVSVPLTAAKLIRATDPCWREAVLRAVSVFRLWRSEVVSGVVSV